MTSLGAQVGDRMAEGVIDRVMTKPVKRLALLQCLREVLGTAMAKSKPDMAPRDNPLRGRRVLLAEDNIVNQKLASRLLEKLGAEVVVANTGQSAIDQLCSQPFDVVLMDCQMPVLDGYEATRRIRAGDAGHAGSTIPIIALTAHALSGDRDRCLAAGMTGYLTKPIDPALLRTCLMQALGAAGLRSPPTRADEMIRAQPSVFDEDELRERVGDDGALVEELLGVFVRTMDDEVVALLTAAGRGEAAVVKAHAHTIKGAAGNVAANALASAAAAVETSASGDAISTDEIEALRQAWRTTQCHPAIKLVVARVRDAS
jgi:CheY-like chemotaxis protein